MSQPELRTAGKGGRETAACKAFGDDVGEIVSLVRATVANVSTLTNQGTLPDRAALSQVLFEMCLSRTVDSCVTYITNALQLIYRHYPAALKSKETLEVDYILQFTSMGELVQALVERKVHGLSYQSLTDLDKYISDKHGLSLFLSQDQRTRAVRLVDIRNLIVHNRGVVNRIFKERNPESPEALGERVRYTGVHALAEFQFLVDWIMDLDARICEKYAVPTQPRVPRPKIPHIP